MLNRRKTALVLALLVWAAGIVSFVVAVIIAGIGVAMTFVARTIPGEPWYVAAWPAVTGGVFGLVLVWLMGRAWKVRWYHRRVD